MSYEIERKFLVEGDFKRFAQSSNHIMQGYIYSDRNKSVRVRLKGNKGYLTVKSNISDDSLIRNEWEYEVPAEDINEMLRLCSQIIEKTRYNVDYNGFLLEIDEFYGDNEGLIVAEIELAFENQLFDKPSFLGKEVTGDSRYLNSELTKNPYCNWKES